MKKLKKMKKPKHLGSRILRRLVWASAVFTIAILGFVIVYVFYRGIPGFSLDLFAWEYNSDNVSLMPALINTLLLMLLTLVIAVPIGVCSAIYMTEYAKKGNKIVKLVRTTTETLTGIPSIVYGLFGMLFFVTACGMGRSILAGALTLAIMVLPTIMRTTEEALLAVPNSFREGSLGIGAGKLRTVFQIVLPSAVPGILSGVILAMGRIVGESAALIYTAGSVAEVPGSLFDSARTLAVHMYCLYVEGFNTDKAFSTAIVLLVFVIGMNLLSNKLAGLLKAGSK